MVGSFPLVSGGREVGVGGCGCMRCVRPLDPWSGRGGVEPISEVEKEDLDRD